MEWDFLVLIRIDNLIITTVSIHLLSKYLSGPVLLGLLSNLCIEWSHVITNVGNSV